MTCCHRHRPLQAYNKDAKNPETLANLVTCGLHLGKNVQRYIT